MCYYSKPIALTMEKAKKCTEWSSVNQKLPYNLQPSYIVRAMEAMTLWVSGVFILSQSSQSGQRCTKSTWAGGLAGGCCPVRCLMRWTSQGNTLTPGWLVWTPPGLPAWGTSRRLPGSSLLCLKTKEHCCWGDHFFRPDPPCRNVQLCSLRCIVKFSVVFKVAEFTPKTVYIDLYTLEELVQVFAQ